MMRTIKLTFLTDIGSCLILLIIYSFTHNIGYGIYASTSPTANKGYGIFDNLPNTPMTTTTLQKYDYR
jgi:hypothetical protein